MKRLPKSIYFLILIVILGFFVGMYNYRKPIPITKTFNEVLILKPRNKEILKRTTIEIDANLTRGYYRGSLLNFNAYFMNKLEGTITIDNKKYQFGGVTGRGDDKTMLGSVFENDEGDSSVFMFKMYDLDSILLLGTDNEWDGIHVVAPAKTVEDYNYISDNIIK
jgi:hypothetical protein